MAGIYIHIPFCRQACHYCDFHFSTNLTNKGNLVNAICREFDLSKDYLSGDTIETIYFGGGSPSLLSTSEIGAILNIISKNYNVIPGAEISFEGNPDDLTLDYLKGLSSIGINRLSIGIQSFNENNLKFLNRVHDAYQSKRCLENATAAGFTNFSLDLIYGIPSVDHFHWHSDIKEAIKYQPKHISAYCLTIEESTAFGHWLKKGKIKPIDNDFAAEQYEILVEQLALNGYEQYEISNYAIPGFYSKHNSSYWKQKKYLGVGPGAHSFNGHSRRYNIENNNKYVASINNNAIPYTEEQLSFENKINEFIITTLRTKWGTDLEWLMTNHNFDLMEEKDEELKQLHSQSLIQFEGKTLYLSERGKLLADEIAEKLIIDKGL